MIYKTSKLVYETMIDYLIILNAKTELSVIMKEVTGAEEVSPESRYGKLDDAITKGFFHFCYRINKEYSTDPITTDAAMSLFEQKLWDMVNTHIYKKVPLETETFTKIGEVLVDFCISYKC